MCLYGGNAVGPELRLDPGHPGQPAPKRASDLRKRGGQGPLPDPGHTLARVGIAASLCCIPPPLCDIVAAMTTTLRYQGGPIDGHATVKAVPGRIPTYTTADGTPLRTARGDGVMARLVRLNGAPVQGDPGPARWTCYVRSADVTTNGHRTVTYTYAAPAAATP